MNKKIVYGFLLFIFVGLLYYFFSYKTSEELSTDLWSRSDVTYGYEFRYPVGFGVHEYVPGTIVIRNGPFAFFIYNQSKPFQQTIPDFIEDEKEDSQNTNVDISYRKIIHNGKSAILAEFVQENIFDKRRLYLENPIDPSKVVILEYVLFAEGTDGSYSITSEEQQIAEEIMVSFKFES